jgi:hypothetical protein
LIRAGLAFAVSLSWVGAMAAELPQRSDRPKTPAAKAHACFIAGAPGFETPGGVCVRVSGYISSQASAGSLRH